jgi:hypothetical protein
MPMNRGWRFSPKVVEGNTSREFDDRAFTRVVIPHTDKVLPWHSFDDKEYEFISTYGRHFKLPRTPRGQRVFVDFEGEMTATTVWINGQKVGEYKVATLRSLLSRRSMWIGLGTMFSLSMWTQLSVTIFRPLVTRSMI